MFKSQLEPPSDNFMQTQIFVENIFDTVKKAREAKAARSLAETKIIANELSPSKRKKSRKNAKGKRTKVTPTKRKQRKPRTPKEPKRTPRKYTKRVKAKPQNDIDDEEAAFILSSISQRSFDSFYNRFNHSNSVVIPLEQSTPTTTTTVQDHAAAYHHVLLDHNYWVPPPTQPSPAQEIQITPTVAPLQNLPSEVNNNNFDSTNTNAVKKRWLRQATTENSSSPTVTPPETSPNDMLKAPLKKRKLVHEATHEINIDQTTNSTSSPFVCTIKHEEQNQQPVNMAIIKPEVKNEILPYTVDKLREIHEKIELEFGRKETSSVIQKVNNITNDHMHRRYDEIVIKSPEKNMNIYDNRRIIQDHQIKIELPDHQSPATAINIQFHQNHNFNIKPEVFTDSKPTIERLQVSPLDTKIHKIVGESLFIKPETISPQIQFIGEGFQKIQQHQPNVAHKFVHNNVDQCRVNNGQNLQIIYNDKIEPQQCQQIVHESIFKIDNNVYKIIENVPRVEQQQQPIQQIIEKKKPKKEAKVPKAKKIKIPKASKLQNKKVKKSPQKTSKKPKVPKSPTKASKNKESPVKIDKEFIKNFADIEDVPLKFRQNLSNDIEIEKLFDNNTNVRGELQSVIEAVNASPLKFEGNCPKFDASPKNKQVEEQISNNKESEKICDEVNDVNKNHQNTIIVDKVVQNLFKDFEKQEISELKIDANVESIRNEKVFKAIEIPENIVEPSKIKSEFSEKSNSIKNIDENSTTDSCESLSNDLIINNTLSNSPLLSSECILSKDEELNTEISENTNEVLDSSTENNKTSQNNCKSSDEISSNTSLENNSDVPCKSLFKNKQNTKCNKNTLIEEKSNIEIKNKKSKESNIKERKLKVKKLSTEICSEKTKIKTEIIDNELRETIEAEKSTEISQTLSTIKKEEEDIQNSNQSEESSMTKNTNESLPIENSSSPGQINQQVASILEKVISRTIKSDQEVPSMEAITSDEEDDTQYRESVEEFHKDTLERLIQANKRFYRETLGSNSFRGNRSFDYNNDYRRPLKASISFESQYQNNYQNQHHNYQPAFNRSISERWNSNGNYGSFHYDKFHHREQTNTYSMYRAQKASQMDRWNNSCNNNKNTHHQIWNSRVEVHQQQHTISSPILTSQQQHQQIIVTPTDNEKITATVSILPKTKTASSDPRLNPSLVQDIKKDENTTPKKKLSLDQYRKRKSLTNITPLTTSEDMPNSSSKSPSPTSHLSPAFDPSIAAAAATG
ncbi:hypothetical protein PVAND_014378 [Polypedilum vanderplanki]|uniref:Uncharacterized protein n=1 Tax=Polypedilum vanderplanki TaxID=319348 RepID=A0A9J6B9K4_POLVA|nr:hypothetical protein PVAND_014378 [Polypedilum vanderplanki]